MWKHVLLLSALGDILGAGRRLLYRESHAGAPSHVLAEGGEWRHGTGRVAGAAGELASHPYFIRFGSSIQPGAHYPASWRQALELARHTGADMTVDLYDTSTDVQALVAARYGDSIRFSLADGFAAVLATVPADFTLIDPPYHPDASQDKTGRGSIAACYT